MIEHVFFEGASSSAPQSWSSPITELLTQFLRRVDLHSAGCVGGSAPFKFRQARGLYRITNGPIIRRERRLCGFGCLADPHWREFITVSSVGIV